MKDVFFGETHIHTTLSMDAFIGGNRLKTDDAYRSAKGEEVMANGRKMKLVRPLDFCAISDPDDVQKTIIERAWSSPIWFKPKK